MPILPVAEAAWTGISLSIDEIENDWAFADNIRLADTTRLNLHFEEKTRNGIHVGANIGQLTTRIRNKSGPADTEKFDASHIGIYLGYPVSLGEHFVIHNQMGYQFHSGSSSAPTTDEQISWREASYLFGISYRFSDLRIMPFLVASDISGDLERADETDTFENDEAISTGLSFDIFVDSTSFVRLKFSSGTGQSFSLRFAREF
ncbi:MAG: hypothetical protein GY806_16690 [Gammaproteobacteria bacterium]|nr:hypothetical protein [Gammaproteobacteria bacterium]